MKINTSCPLAAFITSCIAMIMSAIYSTIPAAVALAIFHELYSVEISRKSYIVVLVITTLVISAIPRKKKLKEARIMVYD